jgi:hypothetical protein
MMRPSALTITGSGLLRELKTNAKVGIPILDLTSPPGKLTGDVVAIWDTGATGSVITQRIVDELAIQPISMAVVHGVSGPELSPVYLVDFYLPSGVGVRGLKVTLGKLPGADVLIGMDVITTGDFAVTNFGGKTVMSFRAPSQATFDFVKESTPRAERRGSPKVNQPNRPHQKRRR